MAPVPKRQKRDQDADSMEDYQEMLMADDQDMIMADAEDSANIPEPEEEPELEVPSLVSPADTKLHSSTSLKCKESWKRAPCPALKPEKDALVFMQVDAAIAPESYSTKTAIINMYGITQAGHSVLLKVHAFHNYFYVPAREENITPKALKDAINERLKADGIVKGRTNAVIDVTFEKKRNIMFYVPGDPEIKFFKVTVINPKLMKDVTKVLKNGGLLVKRTDSHDEVPLGLLPTFEASLDFILRFMIETGLGGCSWLTVPPGKYHITPTDSQGSRLQIEAHTKADEIIAHKPEGKWLITAPLRRLSFDIECAGRKGIFPEPLHDSVIQIANYIWEHGRDKPAAQVVFTLKSCAAIVGADVLSFETEKELLSAWSQFMRASDPDVITGYNIVNFDLPYLLDRAEVLQVQEFPLLGRLINRSTTMRKTTMSSSAFGSHESKSFTMHGRVIFDMLQLITREYKLRSYSLNSVSAEFLGQQKEDVHYSIISDLQRGDEQTRRRLAVYCLKDALLPMRLMDKLLSLTNYMEMARVTGIPLGWLISRGHMVKVVSLLHRKAHDVNLLIPDDKPRQDPHFVGATVIDPMKGYYQDPIATLDFASLYPSIIMAHNLCYSTLIHKEHIGKVDPKDYEKTPTGACFVKESVKKGTLTNILEELLAARKQAKKDLKAAKDPFLQSVLNGRQLALKISANAVYGFTGAAMGKLPCVDISASTTAYGRRMIDRTKEEVEKRYSGATVIYGDTDSVMIKFGSGKSLKECMRLGEEAAEAITSIFPKQVNLEFEKCYYPYLLINKKRYAGLLWTNTEKYDKMDCKGIESVRRDNCRLVANVIDLSLEYLLKQKDVRRAVDMVKSTVSDLLQNKIDVSLLVVSKALTKTQYEVKQAHVVLAEELRKRDAGTAPSLGDRVPYVILHGKKNEPLYMRAEDPLYALEHNLPIDNNYYLENMLRKPLTRIFEPVMSLIKQDVNSLFVGEHTRTIAVVTAKKGDLMNFAKIGLTCLGCKTPIKEGAVCKYCVSREAEIYTKHLSSMTKLEAAYSSLWTECQRCMGNVCNDVLCSNSDCPIFYRRRKAQIDLDAASARLSRFELEW